MGFSLNIFLKNDWHALKFCTSRDELCSFTISKGFSPKFCLFFYIIWKRTKNLHLTWLVKAKISLKLFASSESRYSRRKMKSVSVFYFLFEKKLFDPRGSIFLLDFVNITVTLKFCTSFWCFDVFKNESKNYFSRKVLHHWFWWKWRITEICWKHCVDFVELKSS